MPQIKQSTLCPFPLAKWVNSLTILVRLLTQQSTRHRQIHTLQHLYFFRSERADSQGTGRIINVAIVQPTGPSSTKILPREIYRFLPGMVWYTWYSRV